MYAFNMSCIHGRQFGQANYKFPGVLTFHQLHYIALLKNQSQWVMFPSEDC